MKKVIFTLGLFTLFACGEDVYQEMDRQNSAIAENSSGDSGMISPYTYDPLIPYESPYDLLGADRNFDYVFINDTDLYLSFVAAVNLCYYDGANDLNHFGNVMNPTIYPALLYNPLNINEYLGHSVVTNGFHFPPFTTETITVQGINLPTNPSGPTTASGQFFDFTHVPNEAALFEQYGKVYAIEGAATDQYGAQVMSTAIRFPFMGPGGQPSAPDWISINTPSPLAQDTWYNVLSLEICQEYGSGSWANLDSFYIFTHNGQTYKWEVYTTLDEVVFSLTYI